MSYPPLSESLPVPLPNGQQVRSFAKHCPRCHERVESSAMWGLARTVNGGVYLAARAICPQCGYRFNISCTIAENKTVSRLFIPTFILLWWLDGLDHHESATPDSEPAPPRIIASRATISTESVGFFNGRPIPAWIDTQGRRYLFQGVDTGQTLRPDELLHEGLIFRRVEDKA